MTQQHTERTATFRVQNVGGIDETTVQISPGVTVLTGRNATNRTSFLQSVMAVMGSDDVSLKGDADEGQVTLDVDDETYTRTLTRTNGRVAFGGEPYLDDPDVADLFAFLLESNEARRAVTMGADLRELIMRPIDTESIQREIEQLERKKTDIDDELEELTALKTDLPELETKRTQLEDRIEEKRDELQETETEIEALDADIDETREEKQELESRLDELRESRSELHRLRSNIELQQESIESLKTERRELDSEYEALPETPMGEYEALEREVSRLRDQKSELEGEVSELQDIIQFNERMLDDRDEILQPNDDDETDQSVTNQLLPDDDVVCWTCGSEVAEERIQSTLDQLRRTRQEKLDTIREREDELDELKTEQREYQKQQRRREQIERKREEIEEELERRTEKLDDLRDERRRLEDEIEALEGDVEELESDDFGDILDLHKEANQLEFELGSLESDLEDVTSRIESVEDQLAEETELQARREDVQDELEELRTRIDRIETEAAEAFTEHMDTVLETLGYENLERIWIERVNRRIKEGRRKVEKTVFELHVVRSTDTGATYEDTVDHLSESEREVTGLIFALAGYLVHDLHETVPFMLLDSLEAIDANRLADLVDYFAGYAPYLVVALLPEDAQALDDSYTRVTEI